MSPIQKSFLSAGAVVLACGAVVAGTISRNHADVHSRTAGGINVTSHSLLASLSNDVISTTPQASPTDFYQVVSELLKRDYVDPVTDDNKLTTGAIRGMVNSLDNPDSMFMDTKQFKAFLNARSGKYEGIGVDLALEMPKATAHLPTSPTQGDEQPPAGDVPAPKGSDGPATARIPALTVAAVVPGSPADKAGVKAGDSVDFVDGMWVLSPNLLNKYYALMKEVHDGKAPMQQLIDMRRNLRKKLASSLMPLKAKDRLILGTSGTVKVDWLRDGTLIPTTLTKEPSSEEATTKLSSGAIVLHFLPGAAAKLKSEIGDGPVTLDLRSNEFGDMAEMKQCLGLFAPAGNFGQVANEKGKGFKPFGIESGSKPREVKLLVDGSTRGVAAIFALALESKGFAKLSGGPVSADRNLIETVKLPDGSGYTLVTGTYRPETQARRSS